MVSDNHGMTQIEKKGGMKHGSKKRLFDIMKHNNIIFA